MYIIDFMHIVDSCAESDEDCIRVYTSRYTSTFIIHRLYIVSWSDYIYIA